MLRCHKVAADANLGKRTAGVVYSTVHIYSQLIFYNALQKLLYHLYFITFSHITTINFNAFYVTD